MSSFGRQSRYVINRTEQLLDELVRLQVRDLRREAASQSSAIRELNTLGFAVERIAELLGTTPATVRNDLSREKAAKNKPKQKTTPKRRAKSTGTENG
jgi:predicted transcriptional regulator